MICSTTIFVALLWMIDMSVSALIMTHCSDNTIILQSLFSKGIEPRVSYHVALTGLTGLWLIFNTIYSYKILKKGR